MRSVVTPAVIGIAGTLVILPNRNRVGLIASIATGITTPSQAATLSVDSSLFAILFSAQSTLRFNLANDGDLCTRGFTITSSIASMSACFVEYILPESEIAAAIEEFTRDQRKWQR
jgi:hypothetical protein